MVCDNFLVSLASFLASFLAASAARASLQRRGHALSYTRGAAVAGAARPRAPMRTPLAPTGSSSEGAASHSNNLTCTPPLASSSEAAAAVEPILGKWCAAAEPPLWPDHGRVVSDQA